MLLYSLGFWGQKGADSLDEFQLNRFVMHSIWIAFSIGKVIFPKAFVGHGVVTVVKFSVALFFVVFVLSDVLQFVFEKINSLAVFLALKEIPFILTVGVL